MYDESKRAMCPEWDPLALDALDNQLSTYDNLRGRCPVAHSDLLGWPVLRHSDVLEVLDDHQIYRNKVSQHMSVPSGMDA